MKAIKLFLLAIITYSSSILNAQEFTELTGDYLGQTPPGDTPVVFAPGIVSTREHQHSAPAFAADGKEVYWSVIRESNDSVYQQIMSMEFINGKWNEPHPASFSVKNSYEGGPVISGGGNKLYIYRGKAAPPGGRADTIKIICYTKQNNKWVNPETISDGVFHSVADNGTIYFITTPQSGIQKRVFKNGSYSEPELLNQEINLPGSMNWTPFIAPDESYLIFSRLYEGGDYGNLFISFYDTVNDEWKDTIKLDDVINTSSQERFPTITSEGKYLFFNRNISDMNDDIFWVNAGIINKLKEKVLEILLKTDD